MAAFVGRVLAARMPGAALMEGSLKVLLDKGSSSALLEKGSWFRWASFLVVGPSVWPLVCQLRVVLEDAVVGGAAVGLSLLSFLVLGDDGGAGVSPDVDDIM